MRGFEVNRPQTEGAAEHVPRVKVPVREDLGVRNNFSTVETHVSVSFHSVLFHCALTFVEIITPAASSESLIDR